MKEIKFRGTALQGKRSGKVVYGDLCIVGLNGRAYIKTLWCDIRMSVEVDPESVAQFIGYDKYGREVYEGDILQMDYNGEHYEYKAQLIGYATADNGCYITAKQFADKELKVSA